MVSAVTWFIFLGYGNKASKNLRRFSPVCTLPFMIAFVFVGKKVLFKDMDVQRRKAAKIFACFLSGRKRAENVDRPSAENFKDKWEIFPQGCGCLSLYSADSAC